MSTAEDGAGLTTVMFHGLRASRTPARGDRFGLNNPSLDEFRDQIAYLVRHFVPVTLARAHGFLVRGEPLPSNALLVTFDDGFRSVFRDAAQVLDDHAVPAVVFVLVGALDRTHMPWFVPFGRMLRVASPDVVHWRGATMNMRTSEAINSAAERFKTDLYARPAAEHRGMVEEFGGALGLSNEAIGEAFDWQRDDDLALADRAEVERALGANLTLGAHSRTHASLATDDAVVLEREITAVCDAIPRVAGSPNSFSFPDGRWSAAAVRAARASYDVAFGVGVSNADRSRHLLPRIAIARERPRELWRRLRQPSSALAWCESRGVSLLNRAGIRLRGWQ